jgi:hypothetical protein
MNTELTLEGKRNYIIARINENLNNEVFIEHLWFLMGGANQ